MFYIYIGTDTIGCVRIPASYCGVFGFRPSHGAVSTIGVLTNSQSFDTVGMTILTINEFPLFIVPALEGIGIDILTLV